VRAMTQLRFDPVEEARRHWDDHGWTAASSGMSVVTAVMRVQQIFLARTEEVLRPLGLTFSRYEVLMLLLFSREGRLPLGKIGERLQVHAASVTNAIDRLEQQALVARVANPRDGRGTLAKITPKGRRLAERATGRLNEQVFADLPLGGGDLQQLSTLLGTIREAAGDF
jgi:DNA-binding MarR family transcriptional regulator